MLFGHRRGVALVLVSLLAVSCADVLKLDRYEHDDSATGGGGAGSGGVGGVRAGGMGGSGGSGGVAAIDCDNWSEVSSYTSRYHCEVLSDQPASYWRLGEPIEATDMVDQGREGHTGTRVGDVVPAPGAIPNDPDMASSFSGGRIDTGDIYDFPGRDPYTVEAWVMPRKRMEYMVIVDNVDSAPNVDTGWALSIRADDLVSWGRQVSNNSVENGYLVLDEIPLDEFTYFAVIYDGTNLRAYVDGVFTGSQVAHELDIVSKSVQLTIGGVSPAFGPMDGVIDEVAIYDRVLPEARIVAHYAAARP